MRDYHSAVGSKSLEHPLMPPWPQYGPGDRLVATTSCATLHDGPTVCAYLGDPCAVFGADVLFTQKRAVEGYVAARLPGRSIDRYYVDSGRRDGPPAPGPGIAALLADGRRGGRKILVVDCVSRLAPSLPIAFRVLAALWELGIEVHEVPSGVVSCDEVLLARIYGRSRVQRTAGTVPAGGSRRRASVTGDAGP